MLEYSKARKAAIEFLRFKDIIITETKDKLNGINFYNLQPRYKQLHQEPLQYITTAEQLRDEVLQYFPSIIIQPERKNKFCFKFDSRRSSTVVSTGSCKKDSSRKRDLGIVLQQIREIVQYFAPKAITFDLLYISYRSLYNTPLPQLLKSLQRLPITKVFQTYFPQFRQFVIGDKRYLQHMGPQRKEDLPEVVYVELGKTL